MSAKASFNFIRYDGVQGYAAFREQEAQMLRYPEAFAAGTCISRRRENARGFSYAMKMPSGAVATGFIPFGEVHKGRDISDSLKFIYELGGGLKVMKTNLIGFRKTYARRNWFGVWCFDGHELTNEEAHIFVDRAIAAGYTYDEDVPDDLIREWIGLPKKESEVAK